MPEISLVVDPRKRRFDALYAEHHRAIHAYVSRRLRADVADVTAEVFTVAWRRLDGVPEGEAALLWLYGVAYRQVARARRSQWRRLRLLTRLGEEARRRADGGDGDGEEHRVLEAIERLRPADREVLMLVLWERLSHAEAGAVLGCSPTAVSQRLHRARERLRAELNPERETTSSWT